MIMRQDQTSRHVNKYQSISHRHCNVCPPIGNGKVLTVRLDSMCFLHLVITIRAMKIKTRTHDSTEREIKVLLMEKDGFDEDLESREGRF